MKKITAILVFILAFAGTARAEEAKKCDSVGKAEDLWNFNLKSEALVCLDEIIQADPTNTKAHFLKGKMCLATSDYACAHERFSAEPVKAKYGREMAELYKAIGDNRFASGNTKEAEGFYREASLYNPSVSKEVAKELFTKGAQIGNDSFLYLAGRLDSSLNKAIGEYYSSLSKVASRKEDQIDFLGKAANFDNTLEKEYTENREALGRFHLEEGKKWARIPGKEKVTDDHRQAVRKYLGDAVVEAELPEVFILIPREDHYRFDIKKNEKTPYRLAVEHRTTVHLEYFSSNNKFEMRYKNHPTVRVWAGEKITKDIEDDEGTLVATEDTIVFIKATKK